MQTSRPCIILGTKSFCLVCTKYRLKQLEKRFILDGVPLGKLANDDTGRTQPSLNIGIPALNDPACKIFLNSKCVQKTTNETKNTLTVFIENSSSHRYLMDRKKIGAGKYTCSG